MRTRLRATVAAIGAIAALAVPAIVAAEPITIVGGSIFYSRENQVHLRLQLDNGIVLDNDYGFSDGEYYFPSHYCGACAPGAQINLSVNESFPSADGADISGPFVFGGVEYTPTAATLSINAGDVTLAAEDGAWSTSTPFTLNASITGSAEDGSSTTLSFFGLGTAAMATEDWRWFATEYEFDDPAAVPEPGTLLLLGGAAAAAVIRKRRAR